MLLDWYNTGHCSNPPGDWRIRVFLSDTTPGSWAFVAERIGNGINWAGYPTERAAQLAAEAFLWRNGVLALPRWVLANPRYPSDDRIRCGDEDCYAMFGRASDLGSSWFEAEVRRRYELPIKLGPSTEREPIISAAERHLRAELAAWLDELAAKEGAL